MITHLYCLFQVVDKDTKHKRPLRYSTCHQHPDRERPLPPEPNYPAHFYSHTYPPNPHPWIALVVSFEDGCNICLSAVFRDLPQSPWLFKDDREGPFRYISQFSQHPQIQPIGSHWLVRIEFSQLVLASDLIHCW